MPGAHRPGERRTPARLDVPSFGVPFLGFERERFGVRELLHLLFEGGRGVLEGRFVGVCAGQGGAIAI